MAAQRRAQERRLTLRSSGAPTAGHQARPVARCILHIPGLAPRRRLPLSSNVEAHVSLPPLSKARHSSIGIGAIGVMDACSLPDLRHAGAYERSSAFCFGARLGGAALRFSRFGNPFLELLAVRTSSCRLGRFRVGSPGRARRTYDATARS